MRNYSKVYCTICRIKCLLKFASILPTPSPCIIYATYCCLRCKKTETRFRQTESENPCMSDEIVQIVDENHPQGIIPYSN